MKIKVYIGVIGSGKDYTAHKECDVVLAFADQLREDIWTIIRWRPKTETEYEAFKNTTFSTLGLRSTIAFNGPIQFTGRDLIKNYGTDIRRAENPDHWCQKLRETISILEWESTRELTVGISDCRFPNEVIAMKHLSLYHDVEFIHVNYKSDRYDDKSDHESERIAQECLQFWGDNEAFQNYIKSI